jgi:hypothetical protein
MCECDAQGNCNNSGYNNHCVKGENGATNPICSYEASDKSIQFDVDSDDSYAPMCYVPSYGEVRTLQENCLCRCSDDIPGVGRFPPWGIADPGLQMSDACGGREDDIKNNCNLRNIYPQNTCRTNPSKRVSP